MSNSNSRGSIGRGFFLLILITSLAGNFILMASSIKAEIKLAFAEDLIQTFLELEREALDNANDIVKYKTHIENYYPSGSKILESDGVINRIVEMCRQRSIERIEEASQ
ncbi:MAG: hypothetical protein ACF788_05435 [Novipirellula sp. JB048]